MARRRRGGNTGTDRNEPSLRYQLGRVLCEHRADWQGAGRVPYEARSAARGRGVVDAIVTSVHYRPHHDLDRRDRGLPSDVDRASEGISHLALAVGCLLILPDL